MRSSAKLESACSDFEADLVLYYYGEGSADERGRVESHIKSCSRCVRFLDDLRRLLPQMAQPQELPQSFWDSYYQETIGKLAVQRERNAWWRNLFTPVRVWMVPAFGTVAVAVLAVALVLGKGGWSLHSSRSQPKIPQEILTDAKQLEFFSSMDMLESLQSLEALDGSKRRSNVEGNG